MLSSNSRKPTSRGRGIGPALAVAPLFIAAARAEKNSFDTTRFEAYESQNPGRMASHLNFVEDVARRLVSIGYKGVIDQMAVDDDALGQSLHVAYGLIELNFQSRSDGTCDATIPLTPAFYRMAAAEMLATEQNYFGRKDEVRGYDIAREMVANNNTPFHGFSTAALVESAPARHHAGATKGTQIFDI